MSSPQADPVATWLAGARWDVEHGSISSAVELYAPRLLAAVEAVLALHKPSLKPVLTRHVCADHADWRIGADLTEWRARVDACGKCLKDERYVCTSRSHSCPDDDEYPCAEVRAITAALLGEG